MKNIIPLILILIIGCTSIDMDQEKEKLLQTDIAFSERSVEVGNHQAFLEYASPDVVLLKPNSYPIIGKPALKQMYSELSDSNYRLTWTPNYGRISKSGDLGYTFGIYLLEITSGDRKGESQRGTYCSIWEKTAKNQWRFVLDTGNPGLGDEQSK